MRSRVLRDILLAFDSRKVKSDVKHRPRASERGCVHRKRRRAAASKARLERSRKLIAGSVGGLARRRGREGGGGCSTRIAFYIEKRESVNYLRLETVKSARVISRTRAPALRKIDSDEAFKYKFNRDARVLFAGDS